MRWLRLAHRAMRLPKDVRAYRRRQQQERVRAKQDAAVVALLEGRYGKARQFAEEALAIPRSPGLPALIAARAALETRDFAEAARLLGSPDAQTASLAVPRLMLEAEMKLEQARPAEALATLAALRKEAGLAHGGAAPRVARNAGRGPLRRDSAAGRPAGEAQGLRRERRRAPARRRACRGARRARERAPRGCAPTGTISPKTSVACRRSRALRRRASWRWAATAKRRRSSRRASSATGIRRWSCSTRDCRTADSTRQLGEAERWLTHHNQDPALLYALGILCQREQLWGKAQTYLEASLALDDDYRTHVALGELFARLGRNDDANAHLAAALKLALAELGADRNSLSSATLVCGFDSRRRA